MTERRAYNLRSGGSETVTLPVQFEVSDDRFMSELLQYQQSASKSGQVSDLDSNSEHDESTVDSDTEQQQVTKVLGLINNYQVVQMTLGVIF